MPAIAAIVCHNFSVYVRLFAGCKATSRCLGCENFQYFLFSSVSTYHLVTPVPSLAKFARSICQSWDAIFSEEESKRNQPSFLSPSFCHMYVISLQPSCPVPVPYFVQSYPLHPNPSCRMKGAWLLNHAYLPSLFSVAGS